MGVTSGIFGLQHNLTIHDHGYLFLCKYACWHVFSVKAMLGLHSAVPEVHQNGKISGACMAYIAKFIYSWTLAAWQAGQLSTLE